MNLHLEHELNRIVNHPELNTLIRENDEDTIKDTQQELHRICDELDYPQYKLDLINADTSVFGCWSQDLALLRDELKEDPKYILYVMGLNDASAALAYLVIKQKIAA